MENLDILLPSEICDLSSDCLSHFENLLKLNNALIDLIKGSTSSGNFI